MTRVVIDASALLEHLLRTPRGAKFTFIVRSSDADLHVPALADIEIASALVRFLVRRQITAERASQLLSALNDFPLTRHLHLPLLTRAIGLRNNFSVYDAVYVALAERLDATLVTADEKLATAARRHTSLEIVSA